MKIHKVLLIALIGVFALAACTGNTAENGEEEMMFSEEEVMDQPAEEGMEFSEEEAMDPPGNEGSDVSEDDVSDEEPEMEFDEDEVDPVPTPPDVILPPEGTSNWQVTHDEGTVLCPEGNISIAIEASPPETVSILVGVDAAAMIASGLEGGPEIDFFLFDSGPGGSLYRGYFQPPGFSNEIEYEVVFTNLTDALTADYLMGTISSEEQGCVVSRSFSGNRID